MKKAFYKLVYGTTLFVWVVALGVMALTFLALYALNERWYEGAGIHYL